MFLYIYIYAIVFHVYVYKGIESLSRTLICNPYLFATQSVDLRHLQL